MAETNEFQKVLDETGTRLEMDIDERVSDSLVALYNLHGKYRERADLSAEMDLYGYFGEFILDLLELKAAGKLVNANDWCDIGSGGGYPGLPLAIMRPGSSFTLIEPSRKKAEYLRVVVTRLDLKHVRVLDCRAEDYSGDFDAVTCKGLKLDFDAIIAPLLRIGGTAYIFRDVTGETDKAELFSYINPWNGRQRDISIIEK